jgi:P pilus assembly chaperone PapD
VSRVPRWRVAAAAVVLAALMAFTAMFAPVYFHNLELQNFVSEVAQRVENRTKSDDVLRTWVLDKAHALDLPVKEDNVQVIRSPEALRIDVRYFVRVALPGYTVDLHFYPGAGSR